MSYDGFPFSCSVPSNELQEDEGEGEGEGEGEEEGEEITHMVLEINPLHNLVT